MYILFNVLFNVLFCEQRIKLEVRVSNIFFQCLYWYQHFFFHKNIITQETRNQKPEMDFFKATPIGYWINLWQCQWPEGNYVQPRNISWSTRN